MTEDLINGLFEFAGALFCCAHVKQILQDKQVKGVAWTPFLFFTSWGLWNLWFYPAVGCWFSFAGGILLAAVQVTYFTLMVYYKWKVSHPKNC